MKQEVLILLLTYLMAVTGCGPTITPNSFTPTAPNTTPFESPVGTPTLPVIAQAVAEENLTCFFGNGEVFDITVPRFQIVMVVGKNIIGNWILARSEEFKDCWIETNLLYFQNQTDINALPVISDLLPPIITPTTIPTLPLIPDPIELRWKITNYECNDRGGVAFVTIDLDILGGTPPYKSSPVLPINTIPGQTVSIKVSSNTSDGEPSGTISLTVPRSSDFKCKRSGNNPGPPTPVPPQPPSARCNDGRDNDHDGLTDFPADPDCSSRNDDTEKPH